MSEKQIKKKIVVMLLSGLMLFSFITEKANLIYAAPFTSISILFEQIFEDEAGNIDPSVDKEFIYELVANAAGNPMPVGSIGNVYETTLSGNESGSLDIIVGQEGVFEYQLRGSSKNVLDGFISNNEVYYITIHSLRKMDGSFEEFVIVKNENGEKVVDSPFVYGVIEQKEGPHTVGYQFFSGTSGRALPTEVMDLLPASKTGLADGTTITAPAMPVPGTTVTVVGGVWTFVGWQKDPITIEGVDGQFTGVWVYTADPAREQKYIAAHVFESATIGRVLPSAITDLLPPAITNLLDGVTVNVSTIIPVGATVIVNDGVWTFGGWDKSSLTIDEADGIFTGKWTFTKEQVEQRKFTAGNKFESGTTGKVLPSEITNLLPPSQSGLADGTIVSVPSTPAIGTTVEVQGGTWTFVRWIDSLLTINKADVQFVGIWEYTADPSQEQKYTVAYEFVSGMKDKVLPSEVMDLLPTSQSGLADATTIHVSTFPTIGHQVYVSDGVWIFKKWDRDAITISGADDQFIGTWGFVSGVGILPTERPPSPEPPVTPNPPITSEPTDPTITPGPEPGDNPKPSLTPPAKLGKGGIVNTGDTTKVFTLIALAVTSVGVIFLALVKRRKGE